MEESNVDWLDVTTFIGAVIWTAAYITVTPFFAVPAFGTWAIIRYGRRTQTFERFVDRVASVNPVFDRTMPLLLPPPKTDKQLELSQNGPLDVRVVNTDKLSWADRVTQVKKPGQIETPVMTGRVTTKLQAIDAPRETRKLSSTNMAEVLAIMPKRIPYNHPKIPEQPTPMSVLIGYDPVGKRWVWADFGLHGDTIHAFIAGQTRAGKDSEIRLWFTQLTLSNTPEELQFIIIDGKGEWITPSLKDSKHMYVAPVGGFNISIERGNTGKRQIRDLANEAIEDAIVSTIELLKERAELFQKVGATNLAAYEKKTGKKLPMLMVIATDIGTNLQGNLEHLIKFLVLKGGSLGVRAIISMQTASGEDTSWRGQLALTMSGYQQQASADAPNLGISAKAMKYRPSELPSVDIPENRGLFVVRKGLEQLVVRGIHITDEAFETYCENSLPKKSDISSADLLSALLLQPQAKPVVVKPTLTHDQSVKAAALAAQGFAPSTITKMLGFTSNKRFNEMMPIVTAIHTAVKTRKNAIRKQYE